MDMMYAVKGKFKNKKWKSKLFQDAEDMNMEYLKRLNDKNYSDIKQCRVYIHYEEMEEVKEDF